MVRNHLFIILLLCFISAATSAESSAEEKERQKIIAELTYRLDTKSTCTQTLIWSDKGSGADLDGYFYSPSAESSYYIIGGYASREGNPNSKTCVISVRPSKNNPEGTPVLLVPPSDWILKWTDKGSGANTDGSMWNAVPSGEEYKCLGSVIQKGYKKPVLPNYRCVHSTLSKSVTRKSVLWSDKGSGADKDVTVFGLANSKSFFAVGSRTNTIKTYDLNDTASAEPDSAVVEKLLAQRMKEINKVDAEKKRLVDERAKKRLAAETEKNRIAEQVKEQQSQKLEQAVEKKEIAEQSKQQETLEVEAKQEKLEQQTEDIQKADDPEQELITETVVAPPADMNKEIDQPQANEKADETESKTGLKILFVFMLLLLIYAMYRVLKIFFKTTKGDN